MYLLKILHVFEYLTKLWNRRLINCNQSLLSSNSCFFYEPVEFWVFHSLGLLLLRLLLLLHVH